MQILKPRDFKSFHSSKESGISILIILLALMGFGIAMRYISMNFDAARKQNRQVRDAIEGANHARFVSQVIADDSLCGVTDFLAGIKGWELSKLSSDKVLKDTGDFVNYSAIGVKDLKWPSAVYETMRPHKFPDGHVEFGKAKVTSVIFIQPKEVDPLRTEVRGKTYWRVPVWVKEKGTFNGKPVIFNDSIKTYIELDPADPSQAIACYRDVSARSLCIDAGGDFDARAGENKCLMPKQHPSERQLSNWQFSPGGTSPLGSGQGGPSRNRWNWGP